MCGRRVGSAGKGINFFISNETWMVVLEYKNPYQIQVF